MIPLVILCFVDIVSDGCVSHFNIDDELMFGWALGIFRDGDWGSGTDPVANLCQTLLIVGKLILDGGCEVVTRADLCQTLLIVSKDILGRPLRGWVWEDGVDYEEERCDHGGDSGGCSQRCHGPGGWVREARWARCQTGWVEVMMGRPEPDSSITGGTK